MPCPSIYKAEDHSNQFNEQVHDMMCADMGGEKIKLQNSSTWQKKGLQWFFIIDTCEALSEYTGAKDCVDDTTVRGMMNDFIVTTKTTT